MLTINLSYKNIPYKLIKRNTSVTQSVSSQHFARFLLSYFKPANKSGYFMSNRTLRDVKDLKTMMQKPITLSNLSVSHVSGLLKLLKMDDFMNAVGSFKDLPQKILDEILRDFYQNYSDQKLLSIIQFLNNHSEFAKKITKENMVELINKTMALFVRPGLLPKELKTILSLFKSVAKHHPTLFKDFFNQIQQNVCCLRNFDSFKIFVCAIKEYDPSSVKSKPDSCCSCLSPPSSNSLSDVDTFIRNFKQFAIDNGLIVEANQFMEDLFSDGSTDYNYIQSNYSYSVSIANGQLVNLLLDKKVKPTHLGDYLKCHLTNSPLSDIQFNDLIRAIRNQEMSQLETAYYGSNKNRGLITSKINNIIENELNHNSSYNKLIQTAETSMAGQLPSLSKIFLLERLLDSIESCSDELYLSKLKQCFLNLIATKMDNFSDKILLNKPLSERIVLGGNKSEAMYQLFLITDNLLSFRDIDSLTHLWAIVAKAFRGGSIFNSKEDEFKADFVTTLINLTLDIIGDMPNKDDQKLKHLFDSMYYGLRQNYFENHQCICSNCIRSHKTYVQMIKPKKRGYIGFYLTQLIVTYFTEPEEPLFVTKF